MLSVSKADAKVRDLILTTKCFRKFFKTFFQGGRLYVPKGLIRSRSLSHAKVRYWVQILIKESNAPTFVSPSRSHCFVSAASLPIAVAKVAALDLTAKHILRFFLNFFETSL